MLSKLTNLKELDLNENDLRSSVVARMLASIQQSSSQATIETLDLYGSYWNEHEACQQLANLLATATALKTVWITY